MTWFWQFFYDICTTKSPSETLRYISGISNLVIGLAYYWIPINMSIVFRRHKNDILYPWLWLLFVVFIAACGTTHIIHLLHIILPNKQSTYGVLEVSVLAFTAIISVVTAIGFTFILPTVMRIASPKLAKRILEGQIASRTADLEEALKKEKLLTREVHHRVKNNLQVIASLINMQVRRSSEENAASLADLEGRISAIAKVHNQLQEVTHSHFDLGAFAQSLCKNFSDLYKRNVEIHTDIEQDNFIPYEEATPKALIINEVISNVFKHGFETGKRNVIEISLKNFDDGVRVLRIKDNGKGMKSDSKKGVGLKLIDKRDAGCQGNFGCGCSFSPFVYFLAL